LKTARPETVYRGTGVSPGLAYGHVLKLDSHHRFTPKTRVAAGSLSKEINRLRQAVRLAQSQLEGLRRRLEKRAGKEHSFILDAHLLMLQDPSFLAEIESIIRAEHVNAEWAIHESAERIRRDYESLDDEYFRERGRDFDHVTERLLATLSGAKQLSWQSLPNDVIVVAHDLSPSAFAVMDLHKVRGVALERGGRTSHTAILARSLRLPTVIEVRNFVDFVKTGDPLIVDADNGQLILRPSASRRRNLPRKRLRPRRKEVAKTTIPGATITKDGVPVSLRAHTDLPHEVIIAKGIGADGIGMFRSEFIYFMRPQGTPDLEEQCQIYGMLAREMSPATVAVRTLDTGMDRLKAPAAVKTESNPSMGLRGIWLSLARPDLFATQIEAILRATEHGNVEIVLPMVSTVEEILEARKLIQEVQQRLAGRSKAVRKPPAVGAMIEVPAAVLTLDSIAREADFFCVGTNDLVQYLLAADRDNPLVAHLFQPLHPAVLQCLRRIVAISREFGKPARICGEISANPFMAILLLGMGYRQLSMNPLSIPVVRELITSVRIASAESIAERIQLMPTVSEITGFLLEEVPRLVSINLDPFLDELQGRIMLPGPSG